MYRSVGNAGLQSAQRVQPPAPLLAPAFGVVAGIVASQATGYFVHSTWLAFAPAAAVLSATFARPRTDRLFEYASRGSWLWARVATWRIAILCAIAGAIAGFVRDQHAMQLADGHIARFAIGDRSLTRIEGVVVTAPAKLEWIKRNPFAHVEQKVLNRFVLDARSVTTGEGMTPACGLVRVTAAVDPIEARPGDRVEVTGWLSPLRGPQNPGEPDFAALSRRRGIHLAMSTESPTLIRHIESGAGWLTMLDSARNFARRRMLAPFDRIEDEPARLLDAMVLGQRSSAGQAVSQAFLRTGTIHFLSVSGFHVGLLGLVTWWFVRVVLRRGPRTAASATLAALLAYCIIAEPNSPILRATAMGVLACVAILIGRPMSPVNWLAASALGILLISPQELFDGGFQLSFVQVAALLVVVPSLVQPWLRRDELDAPGDADTWPAFIWLTIKRIIVQFAATAVVCWCAAIPLSLYHFGQFTPWGAAQSMLISPLVIVVSLLGFLSLLLSSFSTALGWPIGVAMQHATNWLMAATDWLSAWPFTYLESPSPPVWLVAAMYVPLILAWLGFVTRAAHELPLEHWRLRRKARILRIGALAAFVLVAGFWLLWERTRHDTRGEFALHVLAVGGGSAALVVEPGGRAAMFDCGTQLNRDAGDVAVRAMRALGAPKRLDFVTVSHANFDHFSGLPKLVEERAAERFICSPLFLDPANPDRGDVRLADEMKRPLDWSRVQAGDRLPLGAVNCEVLWPPPDILAGWRENDRSLVLRLPAHGRRILLTGDIEQRAMRALLEAHAQRRIDLRSDILIAPHHGSITTATDEFYRAVEPEVVLVSTGDERDRLKALVRRELGEDCHVLTTHECGAITVRIRPDCSYEAISFRRSAADTVGRSAAGR